MTPLNFKIIERRIFGGVFCFIAFAFGIIYEHLYGFIASAFGGTESNWDLGSEKSIVGQLLFWRHIINKEKEPLFFY